MSEDRPCTCHPDDAPPVCAQKYAASECRPALGTGGDAAALEIPPGERLGTTLTANSLGGYTLSFGWD